MRVVRVEGAVEVARLLRTLADEVEDGTGDIDGHEVNVSGSVRAVVEFPDDDLGEVTLLDLHLLHPTPGVWSPTELESAMAHPGD
jgi:hypothetical protein